MFYGDCLKMSEDFAPNFGDKRIHHENPLFHTSFFNQEILDQKQHDCCPPPTLLFSASSIEDKN
jgi:hypothetical protein